VPLEGGGSIVIDQTEALVAIDVNSGRVKEKDIEETARATNIAAAEEIARQLILRDMGGLVVVDFIDMREKKYVKEVEHALKEAFKHDKARTKIGHISEFGLLEMSRQRIKSSVNKGTFDSCLHCSGTGRLRSMESVAMSVLRRIYETCSTRRVRYVIAMMPPQAARYLLNARRGELATVEKHYHLQIEVVAVDGMPATQVVLEHLEDVPLEAGAEKADKIKALRVTQELDLVRNMVVKREEVRLQLETASRRQGRVDIAEIYKEIREMTPLPERVESARSDAGDGRRPRRGHGHGRTQDVAEPAVVAPALVALEPVEVPQPPRARGFGAWFKSLFGLDSEVQPDAGETVKPQPAPVERAPVSLPAPAPRGFETANDGTNADFSPDGGNDERRRRRRRRRGDRGSEDMAEGAAPVRDERPNDNRGLAANDEAAAERAVPDSGEPGEGEERQGRRRRGRRGGRGEFGGDMGRHDPVSASADGEPSLPVRQPTPVSVAAEPPPAAAESVEPVAEDESAPVEAAVDVGSLKEAMLEKLRSEALAETPPVVPAPEVAEAPKPPKNRFVVDLRTGSR
jgi:ribonuclease E